jgi:hypothetical protein
LKSPLPGDIELDLLFEFEDNNKTDFVLEPGGADHVSRAVILGEGLYLVMITFVGDGDDDFWRSVYVIQVPK